MGLKRTEYWIKVDAVLVQPSDDLDLVLSVIKKKLREELGARCSRIDIGTEQQRIDKIVQSTNPVRAGRPTKKLTAAREGA